MSMLYLFSNTFDDILVVSRHVQKFLRAWFIENWSGDSNPIDTPLEIGTSLTIAREKNRMTFLLERDKRLFAGRNGHLLDRYARPRLYT